MQQRLSFLAGLLGLAAASAGACSGGTDPGTGPSSASGHPSGSGTSGSATGGGAGGGGLASSVSGTGASGPCNNPPDVDGDGDGWTGAEGDCNDCDPSINPGAIEVETKPNPDGTPGTPIDEDCNGLVDDVAPACDGPLVLHDSNPFDGARAIDLCQQASPTDKKWGVLSARYVSADGDDARAPGLQVGFFDAFGPNVKVQAGARMLALSTGHARLPGDPDACGGTGCSTTANVDAPIGFPQVVPGCDGGTIINDDIALELEVRAPTNAKGFSFDFKFTSFEYPVWVCTPYNDQFVALVDPAPAGSIKGNVAFDSNKNPVSVNLGFFDTCDPATLDEWGASCGVPLNPACPSPPSSYCPAGAAGLAGTGFDVWGDAGATSWLRTTTPVVPGATFRVRFAIWDTGDQALDSTVLVDDFQWITTGAPAVATMVVPDPK